MTFGDESAIVSSTDQKLETLSITPEEGFIKNGLVEIDASQSKLARLNGNDEVGRNERARITAVNGQNIAPGDTIEVDFATISTFSRVS